MLPMVTGTALPDWCLQILNSILEGCGVQSCRVTSVGRGPRKQAEVMAKNCLHPPSVQFPGGGVQEQLSIYKAPGQAVIRIFQANHGKMPDAQVIDLMTAQIALDPDAVSHHCREGVFDIEQNSIAEVCRPKLEARLNTDPRVAKWMHENQCYHLELNREGSN